MKNVAIIRKTEYIFVSLALLVVALFLMNYSMEDWLFPFSIVTLIHFLVSLLFFRFLGLQAYSVPSIILVCHAVFYWGQLWLVGLVPSYEFTVYTKFDVISIYPSDIVKESCLFTFLMIFVFCVSVVLFVKNDRDVSKKSSVSYINKKNDARSRTLFRKIGIIILFLTLPFNIFENAKYLIASISSGYSSIFELSINDFVTCLGWISILGFILLIEGCEGKKKYLVLFLSIGIYGVEMLSGNRGPSVCAILTILCVYLVRKYSSRRLKLSNIVLFIFLIFLLLNVLETIKTYRGYGGKNVEGFFQAFGVVLQQNIIFKSLEEFGSTLAVPSITKIYLNEADGFLYGWTYISSIFAVFPNVFDIQSLISSGELVSILRNNGIYGVYTSIGGSDIAEVMANFSYFGVLFFALIGKVSLFINNRLKSVNTIDMGFFVMPIFALIHYTRSDFNNEVRLVLWSWIILYVIKRIVIPNHIEIQYMVNSSRQERARFDLRN